MALLTELQEATAEARKKQAKDAIKAEKAKAKAKADAYEWGRGRADEMWPGLVETIRGIAAEGGRTCRHEVQYAGDSYTLARSQSGLRDRLLELASDEGIITKVERSEMEPFGSDPMFPHTVYFTSIRFSW